MKSLRQETRPPHLPAGSAPSEPSGLLKPGFLSLLLHMGLVVFLLLNLMSPYTRNGRAIYRVTLRPSSPPGDGKPPGAGSGLPKGPEKPAPSAPAVAEKSKADGAPKDRSKIKSVDREEDSRSSKKKRLEESVAPVEGLKKTERKVEKEKGLEKSLQEALDEIHKKVALDEIQKRVARRSGTEKRAPEGPPSSSSSSKGPTPSTARGSSPGETGSGTGMGSGRGTGTGAGTGTGTGSGGSPWGSSGLNSRLNDYYSLIWAKIKEGWTLPEDLPKGKFELEAIIVLVIDKGGKLQKSWFEKKSGSALYDQMAMRAIRKAEPFPPIPKELSDDSLEIGIRFYPE